MTNPVFLVVVVNLAAQALQLPPLRLALDAFLDRASGRLGGGAFLLHGKRLGDQRLQPRQRIRAVLLLAAVALRLEDDHAVAGDTPVGQLPELFLAIVRQRRRVDVEAQMNRGRDLVDVLPARTLRPDRMQLDLGIGDGKVAGYFQHNFEVCKWLLHFTHAVACAMRTNNFERVVRIAHATLGPHSRLGVIG